MEKKAITVFTASKARQLIKENFKLIDIKPDKSDVDGKRSVFIFERTDAILEKLKK